MGKGEFLFLLQGLKWTVVLAVVSFLCGTVTGLAIALLRTSGYRGGRAHNSRLYCAVPRHAVADAAVCRLLRTCTVWPEN